MTTAEPASGEGQPPRRVTSESILHLLEERIGAAARISLPEPDTLAPAPPAPTAASGRGTNVTARYQVLDLLGQGGVGAVHRGRDADLGREVAMKFLHEQYRERPDILQRFVEEAQIGGQLQHPGIVPVYELGMVDGQPFFAMKMVKGTTLANRLDERESPQSQRGTFLAIFEQICQTIAYAHARGVVHRDLKPANVMIGSFGEVQVVDWGMGKVLPIDGEARETAAQSPEAKQAHSSVIRTVRSDGHGTQSLVGSVMGTPAYMPREQAIGDVEAMDRRSDVFALGAILCEILTGKPPYVGSAQEVLVMAALARLDKAHQRLAECGADPELIELATRCLQMDPAARPESASVVAAAVHGHLAATEARAHEATLRALTLKRTQKYGIALTAVIAIGLCASLWFWRDADAQRVAAQDAARTANQAKTEEQKARVEAEANLANFNRLSQVVRLEAAKASAQDLFPAWPERIDALREWQESRARPLREALVGLKETLLTLERRARAVAGSDRDGDTAAGQQVAAALAQKTAQLQCWRAAAAVRSGNAKVQEVDLSGAQLPTTAQELNALAWPLIDPARTSFGREAEGLELARRAVAAAGNGPLRPMVLDTLAWACIAVGLDRDALEHSEAALAGAPTAQAEDYAVFFKRVREQVRRFNVQDFAGVMSQLEKEIAELRRELEGGTTWAFDNDADTFLHGTLQRLVADVEAFENEQVADVALRRRWAERIHEASITRHAARWQAAHDAIAKADGVTASKRYAAVPIDLQPQLGLVPLGMNTKTGLWEFYHLRSAFDPARHGDAAAIEIPAYDGTSPLDMNGRGIVFVLLPGGMFYMGAQNQDPAAPNFDPTADPDEMPVTAITLAPFFLAKHELTQGQWARLSNGSWPSWYLVGNSYSGIPGQIMDSHPVEQVDWAMCSDLMRRHALQLPTEAQWEYGCRAGTSSPWSSGTARESLDGYANVLDRTAGTVEPIWEGGDAWDDHYKGPAPVGTFLPNPFGLHDMHGNQWEWCQDWFGRYEETPRAGDGLREPVFREDIRASRGGGHQTTSLLARSAYRAYRNPKTQIQNLGLRPARRLLR